MNFLAHLYLSGLEDEDLMLGNFIADMIKGRKVSTFKESIQHGIRLHHKIDNYTDDHPEWKRIRTLLRPSQGKFAGVVTDIFFDHALAIHWEKYHKLSLESFASKVYEILNRRFEDLPPRGQHLLPYMIQHNWLVSYKSVEGISSVLKGMAKRTPYPSNMANAAHTLEIYTYEIQEAFLIFFPDLIRTAGR